MLFALCLLLALLLWLGLSSTKPAGTGTNVSPGPGNDGNGAWGTPDNITVDDGSYAITATGSGSHQTDDGAQLIVGGVRVGTSQHTNTVVDATDIVRTYGGPTDLMGASAPTPAQVNASDFGFAFAAESTGGSGTNWLFATNFGFAIPADATVDGIEANVTWSELQSGNNYPRVDYVEMTVYYTEAGAAGSIGARSIRFPHFGYSLVTGGRCG